MKRKAFFITIEGPEASGKTSVISFLAAFLRRRKFSVATFRDPGSTRVGEQIRMILLDNKNRELSKHTELLLYLAARTQLIEQKLSSAFKRYDYVICDRFFDSTLVYQGFGLGLGKIVEDAVKLFCLGIQPDLTLVLNVDVRQAMTRVKHRDRIESRSLHFHNRLQKGYKILAQKYPARIRLVAAEGSLAHVYAQVKVIIEQQIEKIKQKAR